MKKFFTFKNIIILLVILRLLAFASFYFNYPTEKISDIADTDHYWGLARSIHDDGSFINNEIVTVPEAITFNQPNAFRVPGYPLFLSAFWNFGEQGYTAVPAIQFIIALFCVYLLYLIAKKLFSEKVAQVTAVLFLIEPTFLAINYFVLADTLFILLFLAFIYQLILFFQQGQNKYLVSSSLFLSVGMLVRPVVMYVPIILVITFLFYYRKSFKTFLKKK